MQPEQHLRGLRGALPCLSMTLIPRHAARAALILLEGALARAGGAPPGDGHEQKAPVAGVHQLQTTSNLPGIGFKGWQGLRCCCMSVCS